MRYLSLFTGIGGFELGIGPGHECMGYSEIDRHAESIYKAHFPNHKNYGDITKISAEDLPDFDLLVGGFPCQSFSIAGKRRGFNDTRGTLFFDIARLLDAKRPRLLLLENVKGLLSHDEGETFKTIILALDELGYDLQWQVLNSKDFGVPQNRERVYIVGHLRGTPRPQVFPITRGSEADIEVRPAHSQESRRNRESEERRAAERRDVHIRVPEATKKGYAEARPGQSINLSVLGSKTRRGRVSDVAQTLDTGMQQYTISKTVRTGGRGSPHGSKQNWDSYDVAGGVRRLTPLECERLQGFPDSWTASVSDTQRYKTLGNAVTVNVVQAIIERICSSYSPRT